MNNVKAMYDCALYCLEVVLHNLEKLKEAIMMYDKFK